MSSTCLLKVSMQCPLTVSAFEQHFQMTACGSLGLTEREQFPHAASVSLRILSLCLSYSLFFNGLDCANGGASLNSPQLTTQFYCTPLILRELLVQMRSTSALTQMIRFTPAGHCQGHSALVPAQQLSTVGVSRPRQLTLQEDSTRLSLYKRQG